MKPPTIEEVRAYAVRMGYGKYVDARELWCWYESVGWKRGRTKMTRWRAAVTGWALRNGWDGTKPAKKVSQADEDALRRKSSAALVDMLKDGGSESQRLRGRISLILAERTGDIRRNKQRTGLGL